MITETTTEQLIELIKQHCPKGFDTYYEKYSGFLYGICFNAVKSNIIAEDIMKMLFVKIYTQIHLYDSEKTNFQCWLIAMLGCTVREYYETNNIDCCFKLEKFPYFRIILKH